jgi:hypothetical protein
MKWLNGRFEARNSSEITFKIHFIHHRKRIESPLQTYETHKYAMTCVNVSARGV